MFNVSLSCPDPCQPLHFPYILCHLSILTSFLCLLSFLIDVFSTQQCSFIAYLSLHSLLAVLSQCSSPPWQDFSAYLAFSGIVLHNAQLYETSQLENRRNQVGFFSWSLLKHRYRSVQCMLMRVPMCAFCAGAVGSGQPDLRGAAVFGGFTEEDRRNHSVVHAGPGLYRLHRWWRLNGQHAHPHTQSNSIITPHFKVPI